MSLKAVHLIFVSALIVLALGCAIWEFSAYASSDGKPQNLFFGLAALLGAVGVVFYGRYFLKKLRAVGYL